MALKSYPLPLPELQNVVRHSPQRGRKHGDKERELAFHRDDRGGAGHAGGDEARRGSGLNPDECFGRGMDESRDEFCLRPAGKGFAISRACQFRHWIAVLGEAGERASSLRENAKLDFLSNGLLCVALRFALVASGGGAWHSVWVLFEKAAGVPEEPAPGGGDPRPSRILVVGKHDARQKIRRGSCQGGEHGGENDAAGDP